MERSKIEEIMLKFETLRLEKLNLRGNFHTICIIIDIYYI